MPVPHPGGPLEAGANAPVTAHDVAVAAAALSTTGPGARGARPDDAAVRALLSQVPASVPVG